MKEVVLPAVPGLPSLYRSAVLGSVRIPFSGGPGRRIVGREGTSQPDALPEVRHSAAGIRVSASELTRFQRLIGAPALDLLPSGFMHTLAFPVAMSIMARTDFPLPLLGMIQVRNSVEHRREINYHETLDVSAWAENLRPHPAGTQVELVTHVSSAGDTVWLGRSTYLAKGFRLEGHSSGPKEERQQFTPPRLTARWNLSSGTGRSYAAVSGDYNPIHLTILTAKALGMKRAIAHGMYLASRMVQESKPAAVESFSWSIDFRSPVLLPARLAIAVDQQTVAGEWQSTDITAWNEQQGRKHFTGRLTRLPSDQA